jgi:transposase
VDNYGTHKTAIIRKWFAKRPRFHVHFTPTYGSWINLVERWFAEITTKRIRRGVFRSVKELEVSARMEKRRNWNRGRLAEVRLNRRCGMRDRLWGAR